MEEDIWYGKTITAGSPAEGAKKSIYIADKLTELLGFTKRTGLAQNALNYFFKCFTEDKVALIHPNFLNDTDIDFYSKKEFDDDWKKLNKYFNNEGKECGKKMEDAKVTLQGMYKKNRKLGEEEWEKQFITRNIKDGRTAAFTHKKYWLSVFRDLKSKTKSGDSIHIPFLNVKIQYKKDSNHNFTDEADSWGWLIEED